MKWGIASVKKWNLYQAESILSVDEWFSLQLFQTFLPGHVFCKTNLRLTDTSVKAHQPRTRGFPLNKNKRETLINTVRLHRFQKL